ncbi:DUF2875 family protein [Massilia aurea]|uniref:type VI lipase adapter Tla3 domain-containing protein n=1 Tax=Massilia aurea TaxID=373040 RepID=UPI003462AED6
MSNVPSDDINIKRPITWKYLMGALIAFPALLLLWMIFDVWILRPELTDLDMETTMNKLRLIGIPLLLVITLFGGKWLFDTHAADGRKREWQLKTQQLKQLEAAATIEQSHREYVLEVLGLGVTVEQYRQGKLWNILQQGGPFTSIREPDPNKYPWTGFDKRGVTGSRTNDSLENGADPSPMFWGVPSMYARGPMNDPEKLPSETWPMAGLAGNAEGTGMAWHLFVIGPWQVGERPDQLLEQAFAFFDANPDLPYLVLLSTDSDSSRDYGKAANKEFRVRDGHYIPEFTDASAVLVLARRERVEPLRPYAWNDPDNDYLQATLRQMYYQLQDNVPIPAWAAARYPGITRQPTVAEWLPAAAAFAKHPIFDRPESTLVDAYKRWANPPPKDWKPTPWFPVPWNHNQLAAFDALPSMGFIHCPVFVKFEDEKGKPVTRRDARQKILEAGWQQALQTLPEPERVAGPARIIAAFNNHTEQKIALAGTLHAYAARGGPEIDSGKTSQFIDVDHRMGNTGAATFFVQMAVGVMGSYIDGGASAAINLRDPSGASIVFISPPSKERREAQGANIFKHIVQPSIDPDNYKPPTVVSVVGPNKDISQEHDTATD